MKMKEQLNPSKNATVSATPDANLQTPQSPAVVNHSEAKSETIMAAQELNTPTVLKPKMAKEESEIIANNLNIDTESSSPLPPAPTVKPNTQVMAETSASRRTFTMSYKLKTLAAYEACSDSLARGSLLRKEGLYYSRISTWRKQLANGKLTNKAKVSNTKTANQLTQENNRLKKKLCQAETIIEIQKKVSELLGQVMLETEISEMNL